MGVKSTAVIITTYNRPDLLWPALCSLTTQSVLPTEIVVADDGSTAETKELIEGFAKTTDVEVKHIWQEDKGFRKTLILNKAVKAANSEYLIFTDGDCVSDYRFVERHIEYSRDDRYLVGRCVFLSKRLSERIDEQVIKQRKIRSKVLWPALFDKSKDTKRPEFAFALPPFIIKLLERLKKRDPSLWGGNFSCFKSDFVKINGYNSDLEGWGREDIELGFRLGSSGLKPYLLKNIAISWHLWHPHSPSRATVPKDRGEQSLRFKNAKEFRCENGYDQV